MSHIFIRVRWKTDPFRSEIWYSEPTSSEFSVLRLIPGEQFNIKIKSRSFCIGSESGKGQWITCKARQIRDGIRASKSLEFIQKESKSKNKGSFVVLNGTNFKQCYRCSTSEYFSCRMTCVGDYCSPSSELARQLCSPSSTSVYLTFVGGEYKVGVSLGIPRRWIEQGSDLAAAVVKAPGLEARRLEQLLATELDLKLQVRTSTKIKNLIPTNMMGARDQMERLIEKVPEYAKSVLKGVKWQLIKDPQIHDLSINYGELDVSAPIQAVEPQPGGEFGGEIVGVKGSVLIVRQEPYYYAMNLKGLISREFQFLDRPANIETQSYLGQWF